MAGNTIIPASVSRSPEPEERGFLQEDQAQILSLIERGGLLWTYGAAERQPSPPEWEFALVPPGQRFASAMQECTGCRLREGGID
jgi:hypothetical protein